MFLGEYRHSIDDKGRLTMPARFRDGLKHGFVLTKGLDKCLFAYPPEEWELLEQKLKALPSNRAETRAFVRLFFAGASECELDRQGRVLVPNPLREYAALKKDAVIIGVSNRVEIWAAEEWEKYSQEVDMSYAALAEKLPDFEF